MYVNHDFVFAQCDLSSCLAHITRNAVAVGQIRLKLCTALLLQKLRFYDWLLDLPMVLLVELQSQVPQSVLLLWSWPNVERFPPPPQEYEEGQPQLNIVRAEHLNVVLLK